MLINYILCAFFAISTPNWEKNFEVAKSKANNSDKYLLIYFSGSDWCASCYRFKNTVLKDESFNEFANQNLILYNADFPRKKKNQLDQSVQTTNNKLATLYNKNSVFPKLVLADGNGQIISELENIVYQKGASVFVDQIKLTLP